MIEFIKQWLRKMKIRKNRAKDLALLKSLQIKLHGETRTYSHLDGEFEVHGEIYWRDRYKSRLDKLIQNKDEYLEVYNEEHVDRAIAEAKEIYDKANEGCIELQNKIDTLRFDIWGEL